MTMSNVVHVVATFFDGEGQSATTSWDHQLDGSASIDNYKTAIAAKALLVGACAGAATMQSYTASFGANLEVNSAAVPLTTQLAGSVLDKGVLIWRSLEDGSATRMEIPGITPDILLDDGQTIKVSAAAVAALIAAWTSDGTTLQDNIVNSKGNTIDGLAQAEYKQKATKKRLQAGKGQELGG